MPLKDWVPSFHALVALCVSHKTVITLVGLHWHAVGQDRPCSLPLPCRLTATLLCLGLAAVSQPVLLSGSMPLHGKALDNHIIQALPALCTGHICREDAQLGASGVQRARLTLVCSCFYILTPSSPLRTSQHTSPFVFCLRKFSAPDITSPCHVLNSKASQQDHNLLALPTA